MRFSKIVKLFKTGNVMVTGLKGTGKDLIFSNVIARRKKTPYMSNIDYGGLYAPYSYTALDVNNGYEELNANKIKPYVCPLPRGTDVYLSDCGIYFPAQYCNELNKKYPNLPTYVQLVRQLNQSSIHCNCQNLNRVWDKLRESSDIFLRCRWAKVIKLPFIGKIVFQGITIYENYDACLKRVKPCRVRIGFTDNKIAKAQKQTYIDSYRNTHGNVQNKFLIYRHKGQYDTHAFYKILKGEYNE